MHEAAAEWTERVRAWRESGLSADDFAKREGHRPKTLTWWASELARRSRPKPKVAMARVRVIRGDRDEGLAVHVGPARIAVRRGFDAELLRQVVGALGGER